MRADLQRLKRDSESKSAANISGTVGTAAGGKNRFWFGASALLIISAAIAWFGYGRFALKPMPFQQIEIIQLTTNGKVGTAAISPDGKYVAYSVNEIGKIFYFGGKVKQSLWVRQVTGGDVQVSPPAEVGYDSLTFSHGGESLYVARVEGGSSLDSVYKMPVLGGTAKRLIADIDTSSRVSPSPDGKQLAFARNSVQASESALDTANEDGSNENRLAVHKYPDGFFSVAWSRNGKAIAAVVGNSASGSIEWQPTVISLQDKSQYALPSKRWSYVDDLGWGPDDRGLILTASERNSGVLQI